MTVSDYVAYARKAASRAIEYRQWHDAGKSRFNDYGQWSRDQWKSAWFWMDRARIERTWQEMKGKSLL